MKSRIKSIRTRTIFNEVLVLNTVQDLLIALNTVQDLLHSNRARELQKMEALEKGSKLLRCFRQGLAERGLLAPVLGPENGGCMGERVCISTFGTTLYLRDT